MDIQEHYSPSKYTRRWWGIAGQNRQSRNRSSYNAVNETKLISYGKSLIHSTVKGKAVNGFLLIAYPGQRITKLLQGGKSRHYQTDPQNAIIPCLGQFG